MPHTSFLNRISKIALAGVLLLLSHLAVAQQTDKQQLLQGVKELPMPVGFNFVCATHAISEQPQVVATGVAGMGQTYELNAIITSRLGKGKILILGSFWYLRKPLLDNPDVQTLLRNTLAWGASGKKKNIQIWGSEAHLQHQLIAWGYPFSSPVAPVDLNEKPNFDVLKSEGQKIDKTTQILVLTDEVTDAAQQKSIEAFVRGGGTLVYGSPLSDIINHKNDGVPYDLQLNSLFIKAGLKHVPLAIIPDQHHFKLNLGDIPPYLHLTTLLQAYQEKGFKPEPEVNEAYVHSVYETLASPATDARLRSKIITAVTAAGAEPIIPSPENPLSRTDTRRYASYQMQLAVAAGKQKAEPTTPYVAPASKVFPGEVPKAAARVNQQLVLQVKVGQQGLKVPEQEYINRMHSTGLYVPAGEKVLITLPSAYLSQKLKAQIGVHYDDLKNMPYLEREEGDLTRTFDLTKKKTEIYSPYGGILLITIPDTSSLKTVDLQVKGAVKHPYFKLGETSVEDWKNTIRHYQAPWAELVTDNLNLTVPAYRIRQLDDPEKLMEFWDEVMDANAKLAAFSSERPHPERIIVEQQVAYGYMYTTKDRIVVPDDGSCERMLNEAAMRAKGSWGHFHELGHRHQFWHLDFDGLGEVSVNLYTMYIYDKLLHLGLYNHDNLSSKEAVLETIKTYLANNPSYEKFSKDPFVALAMYIQLIEGFGWEPIEHVYAEFQKLPPAAYPANNSDKLDLWFLSICKATQKNLTSFFEVWQLPVSAKAKASVTMYPAWLPEELQTATGEAMLHEQPQGISAGK